MTVLSEKQEDGAQRSTTEVGRHVERLTRPELVRLITGRDFAVDMAVWMSRSWQYRDAVSTAAAALMDALADVPGLDTATIRFARHA